MTAKKTKSIFDRIGFRTRLLGLFIVSWVLYRFVIITHFHWTIEFVILWSMGAVSYEFARLKK